MSDKENKNLYIGKIIQSGLLKAQVKSFDDNNIEVTVLEIPDNIMQRYLDVDKSYKLIRHSHWEGDLLLWEIPKEQMKRSVSQVLLQWEKNIGWTWDIDS
jgi:hypothetical protein